jgi:hypothetical protein
MVNFTNTLPVSQSVENLLGKRLWTWCKTDCAMMVMTMMIIREISLKKIKIKMRVKNKYLILQFGDLEILVSLEALNADVTSTQSYYSNYSSRFSAKFAEQICISSGKCHCPHNPTRVQKTFRTVLHLHMLIRFYGYIF